MEGASVSSDSQAGLRACDQCRTRKIRCDKGRPCASCRASDLICHASGNRPKEQRQRVLISSKYESKIDAIGDRLAGIERALRDMKMASPQVDNHVQSSPSSSVGNSVSAISTTSASNIQAFEGDTSISAYTTSTNDHLQRALRNTHLLQQDPDLAAALTSLSQIVSTQNVYPGGEHDILASEEIVKSKRRYGVPPAEVVSRVLRECEEVHDTMISLFYPVRPYKEVVDLCKELYFNIEDLPVATLIIAFASLYFIFRSYQYSLTKDDPRLEEFQEYTKMLVGNMMDLVGLLPVLMMPTIENFEALLLGAYYAAEASKPSLCAALLSKATHLCLTLGCHRTDSMIKDSAKTRARKILLFWFLYIMEKPFCLRIGRASCIQDYDIAVPLPLLGNGETFRTANNMIQFWCKLSGVQGRIYEDLYSPRALKQPKTSRATKADALVAEVRQIWTEHDQIGQLRCTPEETHDLFLLGDKVVMSTILTLILRAIPPTEGQSLLCSQDCVAAARQAMQLHQTCTAKFAVVSDKHIFSEYLHWALIHTPFTPFLVIFCHIIETQSTSDLAMLGAFLDSIQPARGTSSAIEKMFLVCDVFHRVAKLFIGAAARNPTFSNPATPDHSAQIQLRKELDPFMTRIGINNGYDAGIDNQEFDPYQTSAQPAYDMNSFATVGNTGEWFSEDQLITTLLGNDFNFMDPNMMRDGRQFM